jgi:hypothetical protein
LRTQNDVGGFLEAADIAFQEFFRLASTVVEQNAKL